MRRLALKKRFFNKLSVRLTISVLLFLVLPSAYLLYSLGEHLESKFLKILSEKNLEEVRIKADRALNLLKFAVSEIEIETKNIQDRLIFHEAIIENQEFANYEEWRMQLAEILQKSEYFLQARIFSPTGDELIRLNKNENEILTVKKNRLQNKGGRDYFKFFLNLPSEKVGITDVALQRENGKIVIPYKPMLRIGKKLYFENGDLFGIFVLNLDTDLLFSIFTKGSEKGFTVIDNEGTYLFNHNKDILFGKDLAHPRNLLNEEPELKANLQLMDSKLHYDEEVDEFRIWQKLYFDLPDKSRFWVFMERTDKETMLVPWKEIITEGIKKLYFVIAFGITGFIVLVIWFFRPLEGLSGSIKELGAGNLSARARVDSQSELGEMAESFNLMAEKLEYSDKEIRKSLALVNSISQTAPNAFIISDNDGVIISVNPATSRIFGYSPEEIEGKNMSVLFPESDDSSGQNAFETIMKEHLKTAEKQETEINCIRNNGKVFKANIFMDKAFVENESIVVSIIQDISEKKRFERKVIESREQMKTITDAVPGMIAYLDNRLIFRFINKTYARTLNLRVEDIIGKKAGDIIPQPVYEVAHDFMMAALRGENPTHQYVIETSRETRYFEAVYTPHLAEDGRVRGFFALIIDITEKAKAEETLQLNQLTVDISSDAVFWISKEGTFFYVNKKACSSIGLKRKELLSKTVFDISTRMNREKWEKHWNDLVEKGSITSESEHRAADGTTFPVEVSANYIDHGKDGFNCAFVRNISARKEAEKAILKSKEKYVALMENAGEGIALIDLSERIREINQKGNQILDYKTGELTGANITDIVIEDEREKVQGAIAQIPEKEQITLYDVSAKRKFGRRISIKITGRLIKFTGEEVIQIIFSDMTERKMMIDKLAKANEEIKSFANIVSHDLRSPLVSLKGFSSELKIYSREIIEIMKLVEKLLPKEKAERANELITEDIPDAANFIGLSASKMEKLVSKILTLARIGTRKIHKTEVNTSKLLDEKLKTLSFQIKEAGTSIEVGELPNLFADEIMIEQIFGNILSNAINYLDPKRRGIIKIKGEQKGDAVIFEIADNGKGICERDYPKVFQLFRRGGKHDAAGEGMGMAYVKSMLERHEGSIWFESKLGEGTTFYFSLPNGLENNGGNDGQ